ncbi:MAG: Gfo/Idh/MocA family oxidoreductase [Acholeplasmataceae bacterium]
MKTKLKVALIGYGMAGQWFHMTQLNNHKNYEVKHVMTRSEKNIKILKETAPSAHVISSFDDAINDQDIDLIVIATSNDVHFEYTKKAILAKKHVVCEKPFVDTLEKAKYLFELAKENKVILRVFHNRRFDGDILTIKDLIKTEDFGSIISFAARFDRYNPALSDNWRYQENHMPGSYYDLAPHLVFDALELFGYPNQVFTQLFIDREGGLADDRFQMILYYDSFECYLSSEVFERDPKPRFELVGTKKTYVKYGFDQPDSVNKQIDKSYQENQPKSLLITSPQEQTHINVYTGRHYLFYDQLYIDIIHLRDSSDYEKLSLMVIEVMEKGLISHQQKKIISLK